jgi:hypothetical protein
MPPQKIFMTNPLKEEDWETKRKVAAPITMASPYLLALSGSNV